MNLDLQNFIFDSEPSRRELLKYQTFERPRYKVQVFRNHSFELVEHTIGAYLDYGCIGISFIYGGYDDSFSFVELDSSSDAVILWVDTTRYKSGTAAEFLSKRTAQLQNKFSGPILVIPYGEKVELTVKGTQVYNLDKVREELGDNFSDERAKEASGTPLSGKALLKISRELGLKYLPSMLKPALKAIVVDLDNTLYSGVLGEDGADGVVLTDGHRVLQEKLKQLADEGYFVCAVSKNDKSDVEELFKKRLDFPLRRNDFSQIYASWNEKKESVIKLSKYLNINTSDMVFVDDNIGELMAVQRAIPNIKTILAKEDANITKSILDELPGLFKTVRTQEDDIRKKDVQANEERKQMLESMSEKEYIRTLGIELTFDVDNWGQTERISQLANKTNQFIFNYKRYTLNQVEKMVESEQYHVVAISMSDKLSDSGLVGVCVGFKEENHILVEECFVSCRALGRGIDNYIVLGALQLLTEKFGVNRVKVDFKKGDRNLPAEKFVNQYLNEFTKVPELFHFDYSDSDLNIKIH